MTQDNWQDCPTMKSVVEAMERGDEIHVLGTTSEWTPWIGILWRSDYKFRCRPAKPKTKKILMCKALFIGGQGYTSYDVQVGTEEQYGRSFVLWVGEPYEVEVPCE